MLFVVAFALVASASSADGEGACCSPHPGPSVTACYTDVNRTSCYHNNVNDHRTFFPQQECSTNFSRTTIYCRGTQCTSAGSHTGDPAEFCGRFEPCARGRCCMQTALDNCLVKTYCECQGLVGHRWMPPSPPGEGACRSATACFEARDNTTCYRSGNGRRFFLGETCSDRPSNETTQISCSGTNCSTTNTGGALFYGTFPPCANGTCCRRDTLTGCMPAGYCACSSDSYQWIPPLADDDFVSSPEGVAAVVVSLVFAVGYLCSSCCAVYAVIQSRREKKQQKRAAAEQEALNPPPYEQATNVVRRRGAPTTTAQRLTSDDFDI